MRTKYLRLGLIGLITVAACWAGRILWRVHSQLVTLDLRNTPLAEVLHKIERQTWTKIRTESALEARVTVHARNKPLRDVLDLLAEQAGAHWSTLYAVYDSTHALERLDSALRGDGNLDPAGWTKLAPNLTAAPDMLGGNEGGPGPDFKPGPESQGRQFFKDFPLPESGGEAPAPIAVGAPPWVGDAPPPDGLRPMPGKPGIMMARKTRDGPVIFMSGHNGQAEVWSPEELLMESTLKGRLGEQTNQVATAQGAANAARLVKAKWTIYLAFSKSVMGVGFGGPPGPGKDPLRRGPNDRYARLTPEQRVQLTRERMGLEAGRSIPGP